MVANAIIRPDDLVSGLPPEWDGDVLDDIRDYLAQTTDKLIVLDDDPSGTQAIPGTHIALLRDTDTFLRQFTSAAQSFHVLMNSRNLTPQDTRALHRHIAQCLQLASEETGHRISVVSRGDVSLRSHFPLETDTLMDNLDTDFDAVLFAPAGNGAVTLDDVHYILQDGGYVPAAETEYAQDSIFGYSTSNLREWVAEKTGGRVSAGQVQSISLQTIRQGGAQAVFRQLRKLSNRAVCVVNIATQRDAEVVALGTLMAQAHGKRFLHRSGMAFASALAGVRPQQSLSRKQLAFGKGVGGLVVVGARTPSATQQLLTLLASDRVTGIEVRVESLLHDQSQNAEVARCSEVLENTLQQDDVVLYTSRRIIGAEDPAHARIVTQRVNAGLVAILNGITAHPRYLAVKGSVTASEVAVRALNMRAARVEGQLLPGVPVWTVGNGGTTIPKMSYVIVPGSLGDPDTLVRLVDKLRR